MMTVRHVADRSVWNAELRSHAERGNRMHMVTASRRWTRADLEDLPEDGSRYEVLDGVLLVTPAPFVPHQFTATRLTVVLGAYCHAHSIGAVFGPGAIPYGESELIPDVLVVLGVALLLPRRWTEMPISALVVEVLSDSTRRRDLGVKRAVYDRWGIPEYWIVDQDDASVTVVRPGAPDLRVTDTLRWHPQSTVPPLEIQVADLFR